MIQIPEQYTVRPTRETKTTIYIYKSSTKLVNLKSYKKRKKRKKIQTSMQREKETELKKEEKKEEEAEITRKRRFYFLQHIYIHTTKGFFYFYIFLEKVNLV